MWLKLFLLLTTYNSYFKDMNEITALMFEESNWLNELVEIDTFLSYSIYKVETNINFQEEKEQWKNSWGKKFKQEISKASKRPFENILKPVLLFTILIIQNVKVFPPAGSVALLFHDKEEWKRIRVFPITLLWLDYKNYFITQTFISFLSLFLSPTIY